MRTPHLPSPNENVQLRLSNFSKYSFSRSSALLLLSSCSPPSHRHVRHVACFLIQRHKHTKPSYER